MPGGSFLDLFDGGQLKLICNVYAVSTHVTGDLIFIWPIYMHRYARGLFFGHFLGWPA